MYEVRRAIQRGREGGLMKLVWLTVKGKHFPTHTSIMSSIMLQVAQYWTCRNIMFSDGRKPLLVQFIRLCISQCV